MEGALLRRLELKPRATTRSGCASGSHACQTLVCCWRPGRKGGRVRPTPGCGSRRGRGGPRAVVVVVVAVRRMNRGDIAPTGLVTVTTWEGVDEKSFVVWRIGFRGHHVKDIGIYMAYMASRWRSKDFPISDHFLDVLLGYWLVRSWLAVSVSKSIMLGRALGNLIPLPVRVM